MKHRFQIVKLKNGYDNLLIWWVNGGRQVFVMYVKHYLFIFLSRTPMVIHDYDISNKYCSKHHTIIHKYKYPFLNNILKEKASTFYGVFLY